MLDLGVQRDVFAGRLRQPCDGNTELQLFPRQATGRRESLGCLLALAMALLSMESVGADSEVQSEANDHYMLPIAAHAVPFYVALLCTLYVNNMARRVCDLSRMHRWVVLYFWLSMISAVVVSTWYIAAGKHGLFHLLLEGGSAAVSMVLIFHHFIQWAPDTRRGHVIATWLRHGIKSSWGEDKEAMANVHNSLDAIRCIPSQYPEKILVVAALSIAPLKWNKEVLGMDVWAEMEELGLARGDWQGTDRLHSGVVFDPIAHCIMSLHSHLCPQWLVSQGDIFPQLWVLKSRQRDMQAKVKTIMIANSPPQIVQRLGFRKWWTYASASCLLIPEIRQVLCSKDTAILEDGNHEIQSCSSQDDFLSIIPQVTNCIYVLIIINMASVKLSRASYYALLLLAVVGYAALPLWGGMASLVWALLLWGTAHLCTYGHTAPSSKKTWSSWSGITIKWRADEDIDRHDILLISLARLYKLGDLTLQASNIHRAKRRMMSRCGQAFMDKVWCALESAEKKVFLKMQTATGLEPGVTESIGRAEIEDLRKLHDEDAFGSMIAEIENLVIGTPAPSGHQEEPVDEMHTAVPDVDIFHAVDAALDIGKRLQGIAAAAKTNIRTCQAVARETSTIEWELASIKTQRNKIQNLEPSLKKSLQAGLENVHAALKKAEHLVKEAGYMRLMTKVWNARGFARGFHCVRSDLNKAVAIMKEAFAAIQNVRDTKSEQQQKGQQILFTKMSPVQEQHDGAAEGLIEGKEVQHMIEMLPEHLQGLQYNHNVIHFLKHQLNQVSDLERPYCATPESWEEFETVIMKGQRLIRMHQITFDPLTFYDTGHAVHMIEQISRALYAYLEEWGLSDTVKCSYEVPDHLVTEDRRWLDALVEYIFLDVDCSFEDAHVYNEWAGIRRELKGYMKHLQPISDGDVTCTEKIGDGANSTVYKGLWKGSPVAVKIRRRDESIAAFFREVSLHASLRGEHVVELKATTKSGWLVMELADSNLKSKLSSEGPRLPWHLKLKYARQAGAGLKYMHARMPPVMHSDVKSTNFLVFGDQPETDTVKIGGFGLSEVFTIMKQDIAGTRGGTVEWQAPEIYDRKPYTLASDVFSFGVVLYEIVTGNHPYAVECTPWTRVFVVAKKKLIDKEEPCQVKPDDCPEAMHALMKWCCRFEPSERPTMEVVCQELAKLPERWTPP